MVNIFQDVNAQAADIIAPILQTAAIANATRDRIVLTYDEALNEGSERPCRRILPICARSWALQRPSL